MYVEASGRQLGESGRISKTYNNLPATGSCLQFYYHMFGRHQGTFNVYINPPGGTTKNTTPSFSKAGQQGNLWIKGEVSINTRTASVQPSVVYKFHIKHVAPPLHTKRISFHFATLDFTHIYTGAYLLTHTHNKHAHAYMILHSHSPVPPPILRHTHAHTHAPAQTENN